MRFLPPSPISAGTLYRSLKEVAAGNSIKGGGNHGKDSSFNQFVLWVQSLFSTSAQEKIDLKSNFLESSELDILVDLMNVKSDIDKSYMHVIQFGENPISISQDKNSSDIKIVDNLGNTQILENLKFSELQRLLLARFIEKKSQNKNTETIKLETVRREVIEGIETDITVTIDLQGISFKGIKFSNIELTADNLAAITLEHHPDKVANLAGAKLAAKITSISEETSFANIGIDITFLRELIRVKATNLTGADFSSRNLRGVTCHSMNFSDANFRNANLKYSHLNQSNFIRAHFEDTKLKGASLIASNLSLINTNSKTNFKGSNMSEAVGVARIFESETLDRSVILEARQILNMGQPYKNFDSITLDHDDTFEGQNLTDFSFTNANVQTTNFNNTNLTNTKFNGANLKSVTMNRNTIITNADFTNATMENIDLSYVDVRDQNVTITGASFKGSKLNSDWVRLAIEQGVSLKGTDLSDINLSGFDLSSLDLTDAILPNTTEKLMGTAFNKSGLMAAILACEEGLMDIIVKGTQAAPLELSSPNEPLNLSKQSIPGIRFEYCNLTSTNFNDSMVTSAIFINCTLDSATFVEATLRNTTFTNCTLNSTTITDATFSGVQLRDTPLANAIGGNSVHVSDDDRSFYRGRFADRLANLINPVEYRPAEFNHEYQDWFYQIGNNLRQNAPVFFPLSQYSLAKGQTSKDLGPPDLFNKDGSVSEGNLLPDNASAMLLKNGFSLNQKLLFHWARGAVSVISRIRTAAIEAGGVGNHATENLLRSEIALAEIYESETGSREMIDRISLLQFCFDAIHEEFPGELSDEDVQAVRDFFMECSFG